MAEGQKHRNLDILIRARYPLVYVVSWEETRVLHTLAEIAKERRKALFVWAATTGFGKHPDGAGDRSTRDPLAAMDFVVNSQDPGLFVFKDIDDYLGNADVVRKMRDMANSLKTSYKTAILLCPTLRIPPHLEKEITVYDYPLPDMEDLDNLLTTIIAEVKQRPNVKVDVDDATREQLVKAALGLTWAEAENVFAKAVVWDGALNADDLQIVISEKEQIIRKSGILEYYPAEEEFGNVGGMDKLKEWLSKRRNAFDEKARAFGLPQPKGILLLGVQGCGKSLCAKAVASHWNLPLLRLDVGSVMSSLVGSSEENMRRALRVSESISPCILWIDELEKGMSGTRSSDMSDAGTTARVFGSFITWLQEKTKPVFVIATANDVSALPPELIRKGRFDEIFFVDLPSDQERQDIFVIHLRKRGRDPAKFDLAPLTTETAGFSGAEIEQVVIGALYDAFDANRDLEQRDMSENIRATVPLSEMMREEIEGLRTWAQNRARKASSAPTPKAGGAAAWEIT